MARKSEIRREALRNTLIELAEAKIAHGGIASVRARDLAREAGCALGAIYNVFDDLNALFLAINLRTFQKLGQKVAASQAAAPKDDPRACLMLLARDYLDFAATHTGLWHALFEVDSQTEGDSSPEWYHNELAGLLGYIAAPVRQLCPESSEDEIDLRVRALFSSVHGIVMLGLDRRATIAPRERLEAMFTVILQDFGK